MCEAGLRLGELWLDEGSWEDLQARPVASMNLDAHGGTRRVGGRGRLRHAGVETGPTVVPDEVLTEAAFGRWVGDVHGTTGRLMLWDDTRSWWLVNVPDLELDIISSPDQLFRHEAELWSDCPFGWRAEGWADGAVTALTALAARYALPLDERPLSVSEVRDRRPWLGRWEQIAWAQDRLRDGRHTPYATAQIVLTAIDDERGLWAAAGRDLLRDAVRQWDQSPADRNRVDDAIRAHIDGLTPEAIPPRTLG